MAGTAFNPLNDGLLLSPDPGPPPPDTNAGATRAASMGPSVSGQTIADLQGTRPITGQHNIPLHVAFLGLVALGIVILLRRAGFHGMVAGRLSLGGR